MFLFPVLYYYKISVLGFKNKSYFYKRKAISNFCTCSTNNIVFRI